MIFGPILPAKQHSTQIKRIHNYYMTIWVMSLDYTELTKETTSLVVGDWLTQTVNPFSNFKQKRIKLHYFPNLHECWGWFHHIPPKPSYLNIFKPRTQVTKTHHMSAMMLALRGINWGDGIRHMSGKNLFFHLGLLDFSQSYDTIGIS